MDIKHLKTLGYDEAITPTGQEFLIQDFGENRKTFGSRYEYRISFGNVDLSGSAPTMNEVYIDIQRFQAEFGVYA